MSSSNLNPSFILNGINDTSFGDKPVPTIEDNEILVAVKKTGICGSDLHFYCHGRIGITAVTEPMVLGHESAGVVEKVGANVTHLVPGDRVAIEPSAACHFCTECKSGTYHLCQKLRIASVPPHDGTLAKYFRVPGDVAYKLPDGLTFEDGAMIEPLAVAVHAVHTLGKLSSNQTIAVYGCGPIGLLCMAVARAMGAARVVGIDIAPERLAMAKKYAATDVWIPLAKEEGEDMMTYGIRNATAMMQTLLLPPHGPGCIDLVVEASGAEASVMTGVLCAKVGGTFVQVGMGTAVVQVPITALLVKELKLLGSFRYGHGDYPLAISLVASGKIDLKPLVTHRFGFEQALEALHTMRDGKGPDGKPAIKCLISAPGESVEVI